ncbi:MAG: PqqD family protein [Paracoccaceae bacterium]|nr:PqqD family protein [Paracoccaceae bacterium]
MAKMLRQNPELEPREVEGQIFLIDEEGGKIHHLNRTASAVWRLLETPFDQNAIIDQFRFLYPDEDAKRLKKSIRSLLRDLADQKVLIRVRDKKVDA